MALYTVNISSAGSSDVVSLTDGSTYATLEVSAGRGPKGDGWTGVTYDNGTGRFTFTSTDGLGYVSDSITGDLDTAVTEAEAAQAAAEAAQAATENIFDQFGDQYLGPKASDPTVDNDGDPLTEGDIYFNTTDDVLKFYSGTAWVAPESIATTAATAAQAAQTAAETAETNAETAEINAATSASNASTSETNAANSEAAAATSASEAAASAASINPDSIDINGGTIDGTVIGGTTPAAGSFTTGSFTGDVSFGDNDKAIFGAGSDLQIYHHGSASYIDDLGDGNLLIRTNGAKIALQDYNAGSPITMFQAFPAGRIDLNYSGSTKLATTSTGIDVTGQLVADSGQFDGNVNIDGTVTADGLTVDSGSTSVTATLTSLGNGVTDTASIDIYRTNAGHNTVEIVDKRVADLDGGNLVIRTSDTDGTMKDRVLVGEGGDISFYEDTGTTPKFFWDASAERLNLGDSLPDTASGVLSIRSNSSSHGIAIYEPVGANENYVLGVNANGDLGFYNSAAASPSVTFDDSGNVGIGTSSPSNALHVNSGTSNNPALFESTDAISIASYKDSTTTNLIASGANGNSHVFYNGSEAMRIDSSGNLLVGTTSQISSGTITVSGGTAANGITATTDATVGYAAASFQRTASDGELIGFKKGASTVGSIGVGGGTTYFAGTNNSIRMDNGAIIPATTTGALSDGVLNLGASVARIKDLWLSGGVYLGGTGSANKLDDYEEGTWTPTSNGITTDVTINVLSATYTKIGRSVTVQLYVAFPGTTSATQLQIGGFPFTSIGSNQYSVSVINHNTGAGEKILRMPPNNTVAFGLGFNNASVAFSAFNGSIFITSMTYTTS